MAWELRYARVQTHPVVGHLDNLKNTAFSKLGVQYFIKALQLLTVIVGNPGYIFGHSL